MCSQNQHSGRQRGFEWSRVLGTSLEAKRFKSLFDTRERMKAPNAMVRGMSVVPALAGQALLARPSPAVEEP